MRHIFQTTYDPRNEKSMDDVHDMIAALAEEAMDANWPQYVNGAGKLLKEYSGKEIGAEEMMALILRGMEMGMASGLVQVLMGDIKLGTE